MAKKKRINTSLRIHKELLDILAQQAKVQNRSQNSYINEMLELITANPENVITSDLKLQALLDDLVEQKKQTE